MTYVFDIDGTICKKPEEGHDHAVTIRKKSEQQDYEQVIPIKKRIEKINKLYDEGHTIVYLTARGMGRHKNNRVAAIIDFYDITAKQLKEWGAQYHELFFGKPAADFYIDDKGISDGDFFKDGIRP